LLGSRSTVGLLGIHGNRHAGRAIDGIAKTRVTVTTALEAHVEIAAAMTKARTVTRVTVVGHHRRAVHGCGCTIAWGGETRCTVHGRSVTGITVCGITITVTLAASAYGHVEITQHVAHAMAGAIEPGLGAADGHCSRCHGTGQDHLQCGLSHVHYLVAWIRNPSLE